MKLSEIVGVRSRLAVPLRSKRAKRPRSGLPLPLRFMALGLAILSGSLSAQYRAPDAAPDLMRLIRSEKLNSVLPYVMRDNEVDMWIHAMGPNDPLGFELGTESGFVVFTDRDGGQIERAAFGGRRDPELFDVMGAVDEIADFVVERDPARIALNYSDTAELDTITDDHFALIAEAFDEDLGERLVSADRLIADFLAGRAMAEIALYGRLLMDNTAIIEEQFASIVPGETVLSDLSGDVYVGNPGIDEEHNSDYVIQRGDLVGIFHGAEMMDFAQHNGYYGYVLRDGETELPPEIARLWGQAMELRDIFRRNITAGLTGEENLGNVVASIEEAGYIHIEENSYGAIAESEATQVFIDFHAQGRFVSEEHAPRISATGWGRALTIPLYHTFALAYAIHMPVPAWGEGEHLYLVMHDGATVTERGVEFPAPLPQQIRAIR